MNDFWIPVAYFVYAYIQAVLVARVLFKGELTFVFLTMMFAPIVTGIALAGLIFATTRWLCGGKFEP